MQALTQRVARRVRGELSLLYHKTLTSRFVRQSDEAYATHMPILIGLSTMLRPRRVLELGSGFCSTPLFLDRRVFPSLDFLHSLEDEASWAAKVRSRVGDDSRLRLEEVASVPDWAAAADLSRYDLIFVDDSRSIAQRTRTIEAVMAKSSPATVVAIHDFEVRSYANAIPPDAAALTIPAFKPMTGLVTLNAALRPDLKRICTIVCANRRLRPSDIDGWKQVFGVPE